MKSTLSRSVLQISIFFTLLINTQILKAQQAQYWQEVVDSLNTLITTTSNDTTKIRVLIDLSREYIWKDYKKGIGYGDQAIELSQKINWKKGEANACYSLGFCYRTKPDFEKVFEYHNRALQIFEEIKDRPGIAKVYNELGNNYEKTTDLPNAIKYYKLAANLEEEIGNLYRAGGVTGNVSSVYLLQGNYKMALESCQKGLILLEKINDKELISGTLNVIGEIYTKQKDYKKAKEYFNRSLTYKVKAGQSYYFLALKGLANIAVEEKDYNKALAYYYQILPEYEDTNELRVVSEIMHDMGIAYFKIGKYDQASERLNESLKIAEQQQENTQVSEILTSLSELALKKGRYDKSIAYGKRALAIAEKINLFSLKDKAALVVSQAYEKKGNSTLALQYYKDYILVRDSIFNEEKAKELTETALRYDFAKVQLADSLAFQQEKTVFQSSLANEKKTRFFLFGIVGLLTILAGGWFRSSNNRRKTNILLESQNKVVEIKNQQNEVLLKEIHHRVKNNLQTISSLLSLQSESITDPTALDAVQESRNRVASMALIHQKLYQGENLAAIKMRDYFETIGSTIIHSFGEKGNGVQLEVEMQEMELDVDTAIPIGLITNELITNSLKYAFSDKSNAIISISMKKDPNGLINLSIADNGINNNTGTNNGGTGFGTQLVNLLTSQLGGKLEQSTSKGTSTSIQFSIDKIAA